MADGRCLGFRDKEVQGTCLGMCDKEVQGTYLGLPDIEGGQGGLSMYLGNKFLYYTPTFRGNRYATTKSSFSFGF